MKKTLVIALGINRPNMLRSPAVVGDTGTDTDDPSYPQVYLDELEDAPSDLKPGDPVVIRGVVAERKDNLKRGVGFVVDCHELQPGEKRRGPAPDDASAKIGRAWNDAQQSSDDSEE